MRENAFRTGVWTFHTLPNFGGNKVTFRKWMAMAALGAVIAPAAAYATPTTLSYTGSLQTYIVPTDGHYEIMAYGAQGGALPSVNQGGMGAQIGGDFLLTAGTTLNIIVGGQGGSRAGGGGGSFVYTLSDLLIAAGGGGGGGPSGPGGAGQTGTSGQNGFGVSPGAGGTAGNGGSGSPATDYAGGGGGGWLGAGGHGAAAARNPGAGGSGAPSFAGGAGGDNFGANGGNGGYGGGGGSGFGPAPGGGGGYSGGGGSSWGGGGGGGSFLSELATNVVLTSGVQSGNGSVVITFLDVQDVPEPASMALIATGIAGLGAVRRRRARG